MKLTFGDIVVVDDINIGVIVKTWITLLGNKEKVSHDVYVRINNSIKTYPESKIERYLVRHKYLDEAEQDYQYNIINDR